MNHPVLRPALALVLPACLVLLVACGGGGGGFGDKGPPNKAPTASASVTGESVLQAVTEFDTSGSSDPDGTIARRAWDYGDGTTGSDDSHIYTRTGSFDAVYTVTDDKGATGSHKVTVVVAACSAAGTHASDLSPLQTVCIQTTKGELVMELFAVEAPATVANFLVYVNEGFYAGTLFHRVDGFSIEAGGFTAGPTAKAATHAPIALESNNTLSNSQFTVAMARDAAPNSATTRFYVNLVDNPQLDFDPTLGTPNGNAVFGQLLSGTQLADQIGAVPTTTRGTLTEVPVTDIVIRSAVKLK